jgi:hypothetical protein
MLRVNGSDRDGIEIAAARSASGSKNGAEGASVEMLQSSRDSGRSRLRNRIRPIGRPGRIGMLRRIEGRRRRVLWSSPEELQVELSRSRRYGHQFVLMRIPGAHEAQARASSNGDGSVPLAIRSLVRRVDKVWSEGANVYLLLPECDGAMAEAMLARIRERLVELLSEDVRLAISSAVFPNDGFTARSLLDALERRSAIFVSQPAQLVASPPTPEAPLA